MPIIYKLFPIYRAAYIKAWGTVTVEDILAQGARMFAESDWENGFNILCDYREITEFDVGPLDAYTVVSQDQRNDSLLDQSKCGVVTTQDLVYGFSRMWELLSADTQLANGVFRDMDEALAWLDLDQEALQVMALLTLSTTTKAKAEMQTPPSEDSKSLTNHPCH